MIRVMAVNSISNQMNLLHRENQHENFNKKSNNKKSSNTNPSFKEILELAQKK